MIGTGWCTRLRMMWLRLSLVVITPGEVSFGFQGRGCEGSSALFYLYSPVA